MSGGSWPQLASAMRAEKKYWGVSSSPTNTEAFIESLPGHASSTARGTIFSVNATGANKVYFCWPDHLGTATFAVGGFVGGFVLRASGIAVTDTLGIARLYSIYESVSAGLGTITVVVT